MTKTITNGGFQNPTGGTLTGNLLLVLSQDAKVAANPNQVAPIATRIPITAGNIASTLIYFNDELLPGNTYYTMTAYDVAGNKTFGPEQVSFAGAGPLDLGTLVPLLISPDPLFSNPVLQNPALAQTITGQALTLTTSVPLAVAGTATFTGVLNCKFLENIRIVDQTNSQGWAGNDLGAWINSADANLGSAAGEIWIMASAAATLSTSVVLSANHVLRLSPAQYTITTNPGFTLNGESGIVGTSAGLPTGRGTIIFNNTPGVDGIVIANGQTGGRVEDIGFDGNSRTNHLGAAIRIGTGAGGGTVNRWFFKNIVISGWNGPGIQSGPNGSTATTSEDNNFVNISMSSVGDVTSTLGAITLGGNCRNTKWTNVQIDTPYYAGLLSNVIVTAGGGRDNLFTNFKVDWNAGNIGTHMVWSTNADSGLRIVNFTLRTDGSAGASGDGIRIDGAAQNMQFGPGIIFRPEAAVGTTTHAINVNNASAAQVATTSVFIVNHNSGITDIAAANANSYSQTFFSGNTAITNFTNPQYLQNAADVSLNTLNVGNIVFGNRAADNDLLLRTKATGAGTVQLADNTASKLVRFNAATGAFEWFEVAAPAGAGGESIVWADSTSHRLSHNDNNGGTFTFANLVVSGTSTLTANATLAAVTSQTAITTAATGAATTDAIEWSYASAPGAGDSLCIVSAYVTSGNVNFVRSNPTAATQNVSAIVINWRVIR